MSLNIFKSKFQLILLFAVVVGAFLFIGKGNAAACSYGPDTAPNSFCGYFYGTTATSGGYVFSGGIYQSGSTEAAQASSFISIIEGDIAAGCGSRDGPGAAFVVLTMMGQPGYPSAESCGTAASKEGSWASLVNQYAAANLINFNYTGYNYSTNTFYASGDIEAYGGYDSGSGPVAAIAFMDPSGGGPLYIIKHLCGNPVGNMQPLKPIGETISGIVYYYNGGGSIGLDGVPITYCAGNTSTQPAAAAGSNAQDGSGGTYTFSVNSGTGFCVRVPSTYTAPDGTKYSNPHITPGAILSGAGATPTGSCGTNTSSYENQKANTPNSPGSCNYGNIGDGSYNIAYLSEVLPASWTISVTASCSQGTISINGYNGAAPSGATWVISGGASGTTGTFSGSQPNWYYNVSIGSPSGSHTFTASWNGQTSNSASFTCINNPCPNWGAESDITNPSSVNVNLNEPSSGYPDGTSAPSGYASGSGSTYYQDIPNAHYWINDVYDTNWSFRSHLTWSPSGTSPNPNPFTLNYNNFINNYPYDVHFVEIQYYAYYDRQEWVANTSQPWYGCSWPSSTSPQSSSTCTYSACYEGGSYYSSGPDGAGCYSGAWVYDSTATCPAGDYESGGSCYSSIDGSYQGSATCPAGDSDFGGSCEHYDSQYYYYGSVCPYDGASYNGSYCYYSGNFLGYSWETSTDQTNYSYIGPETQDSSPTNYSSSGNPPTEPACWSRTFDLRPQDSTTVQNTTSSVDNPEDPTQVTVSGHVQGNFGISGPIKGTGFESGDGTQVNGIDTEVTYDVWHQSASGTWTERPTTYQGRTSGNIKSTYDDSGNTSYNDTEYYPVGATLSVCLNNTAPSCSSCTNCLEYGDEVCANLSVNPADGTVYPPYSEGSSGGWSYSADGGSSAGNTRNQQNAAQVEDAWPPASTTNSPNWPPGICTQVMAAEPYLKVFGGDTTAGYGMQTNSGGFPACSQNIGADLWSWNYGSGNSYIGAGTQLAAFAANTINGYASAQNAPGSSPPNLSFASPPGSYGYGGNFSVTNNDCADNYWGSGVDGDGGYSANLSNVFPGFATLSAPGMSKSYASTTGITVGSTNIASGNQVIVYVNGDLVITGNILYNSISGQNPSQLPGLTVVVNGNVDIAHNVTEIDGNYIATSGINDCYDILNNAAYYTDPGDTTPSCKQQLIVNGSLLTNGTVDLYRTCDSLHQAGNPEYFPSSGAGTTSSGTCNSQYSSTSAAESVGYSGLVWLTSSSVPKQPPVQAITSLPPVL